LLAKLIFSVIAGKWRVPSDHVWAAVEKVTSKLLQVCEAMLMKQCQYSIMYDQYLMDKDTQRQYEAERQKARDKRASDCLK
jgi:hypothetical protein